MNETKKAPSGGDNLWGAKAIANHLEVTEGVVYSLAEDPSCPITRPSGKYFARKSRLDEWLDKK